MPPHAPGRQPRQLPVPAHLTVIQWDDLHGALQDAEQAVDPRIPVRVRWSNQWHAPALLHGWQRDDDRGGGWFGCVEYHRQMAPGFGYAVGRWTPARNIESVAYDGTSPF